jgi:hypothetical protein
MWFGAPLAAYICRRNVLIGLSSWWVICACAVRGPYSGKVVGAAFVAGAVTHAVLLVDYGLFKAGVIRNAGLVVCGAVVGFTPIILAALASRSLSPSCCGQSRRCRQARSSFRNLPHVEPRIALP